ncbi:MAG: DAK2 domain-containing protein, partial [Chloroflexi bacterium]|nr:DAK2 domain-containing protein [Chloroflexota bacterium]
VPAGRGYGYCTEFLLRGTALDHAAIRQRMNSLGDSVIVVGDDTLAKVHLHTMDPGAALSFAVAHGALQDIKIDNIDEQHKEYAATVKHKPVHAAFAAVAVANGEGLLNVLRSLGAAVVEGGQTMNPSAQDLLRAVESAPSDTVVILPNNPNIVLTANLVPGLTKKRVAVLPTHSIPQGIAALVAMSPSLDLDSNLPAMQEAVRAVVTIEVCDSIRSTSVGGVRVKKGQPIGLLDGDLVAAGDTPVEVLCSVLARATMSDGALVTVYYGAGVSPETVEHAFQTVRRRYPKQEVELVHGGQPHYAFLVSVE